MVQHLAKYSPGWLYCYCLRCSQISEYPFQALLQYVNTIWIFFLLLYQTAEISLEENQHVIYVIFNEIAEEKSKI